MKKFIYVCNTSLLCIALTLSLNTVFATETEFYKDNNANILCEDFSISTDNNLSTSSQNDSDYDVLVLVKFDYPDIDLNSIDKLNTKNRRDTVKNYYKTKNEQIISELNLEDATISYAAPYAELIFNSLDEYYQSRDKLINVSKEKAVEYIGADIITIEQENLGISSDESEYPLLNAFLDIGILDNEYNGDGIKVGILENNIPESSVNIPNTIHTETYGTDKSIHTTAVASIIGGTTGIAKGADLYFASFDDLVVKPTSTYTITNCLNWLLSEKYVDIINMSASYVFQSEYNINPSNPNYHIYLDNNLNGTVYTNFCAYIDYLSAMNSCLIVKSAGNRGGSSLSPCGITKPGMAVNVLTVGATNSNLEVSSFSSYVTDNENIIKPEVVAPGEKIVIPNIGSISGTSYSTPMVTGIAVKLLHEFPNLKENPGLLKTVIMASCRKLSNLDGTLENKSGFGIVKYSKARKILSENNFGSITTPEMLSAGKVVYESSFSVKPGSIGNLKLSRLILGKNCIPDLTKIDAKMTTYRIKITHETSIGVVTDANFIWDESISYVNVNNSGASQQNIYKIQITAEKRTTKAIETISVAYTDASHEHLYFTHTCVDTHRHTSSCTCGHYIYENHVFSGGTNSYCIICGYPEGLII